MPKAILKDGNAVEFNAGEKASDVVGRISGGLLRNTLAVSVDGKVCDLTTTLTKDCTLVAFTFDNDEGKKTYWHTTSHILAQAVLRLYGDTKLAIGPAIENGFYYDFDVDKPFTTEELEVIEKEMKKIISEDFLLERFELPREQAIKLMTERAEPFKIQLINELPEDAALSFYKQGEFIDLCAGPHITSTKMVKAIKLLSCTGAYWKGDSKNKMLQRIYGTAFTKQSQLNEYLEKLEEAKKRDHRKLGKELELFDIFEQGQGFPFFFPKGMVLRNALEYFWREQHTKAGYVEIKTPIMLNSELWLQSGHWDHYKDNMYITKIDEQDYVIKPMNCPGGMLVFKNKLHSYRDLPVRMAELGLVHRHELSGVLHGLMRVRSFTQDDAHIFMTSEQIVDEIISVMKLIDSFYSTFGFKYKLELSTRPEDSMGTNEQWELATNALKNALEISGKIYKINEGDGAFYGPKIDFHLEDSIGRTWQCGTIQLDFQMPERFDLNYVGADNEKHRPVMIHRVVFGSIERFIAILTEHYAGAFPVWLSPVQVKILPIGERQHIYANELLTKLKAQDLRCEIDERNEKIGYKIREAQLEKVPYMLVIGDKEVEANTVAVRSRKDGDKGVMSVEQFILNIKEEIITKLTN